jgi:hypothetical protein
MKNKYIVLVCGLNIRNHNRIPLDEQQLALQAVADEFDAQPVRDKGSYLIVSRHERKQIADLVVGALQRYRHELEIPGVAVTSPAAVGRALDELAMVLGSRYGNNFDAKNHGIKLNGDTWRAGLALPFYPVDLPTKRSLFHQTKNAMIFGWTDGAILVAKREAKNVHWGTSVTDPASRLLRRQESIEADLTSRSANILRELIDLA